MWNRASQDGSGRMTVLNRPICFFRIFSASDLRSNRLAGLKAFIWSNLCMRHIPNKLTPRGHEDWPDKRTTRREPFPDGSGVRHIRSVRVADTNEAGGRFRPYRLRPAWPDRQW